MASWDEARRCPKCGNPGEETGSRPAHDQETGEPRGTTKTLTCRTELCRWADTSWAVQVYPDGTIAEFSAGPKLYERPEGELRSDRERMRRQAEVELRGYLDASRHSGRGTPAPADTEEVTWDGRLRR